MWGGGARAMLPVIYICLQESKCVFQCVVWYVVCPWPVLQIMSKSLVTGRTLSSWWLGWQMGCRMRPRRRAFILSFHGHQNGDEGDSFITIKVDKVWRR